MQPPFSRRVRVVHDCVESNVHVSEINQRDELVFDAGGVRITRVVWNVLVNFNTTTRSRRQRRSTLDARRLRPCREVTRARRLLAHVERSACGASLQSCRCRELETST
jgi:hypothetical protein